jgi:hypothetical protein
MKVCKNCAKARHNGAANDSWDCEYVHMNEWEHMIMPQGLSHDLQSDLKTYKKFYDKPLEEHLKIADASSLLSHRPNFTRLWVC